MCTWSRLAILGWPFFIVREAISFDPNGRAYALNFEEELT